MDTRNYTNQTGFVTWARQLASVRFLMKSDWQYRTESEKQHIFRLGRLPTLLSFYFESYCIYTTITGIGTILIMQEE